MGKHGRIASGLESEASGSYGKVAKVGAAWAFFRQGVSQFLQIPSAVILARLLSPTDFGIAAAAHFFVMLANRFSQFGLNAAIVRQKDVRPEHLSSVFLINLAGGILFFVLLVAIGPFAGDFYRSPETGRGIQVAALTFLMIPFGSVPMALLLRQMRFKDAAMVEWSFQATYPIASVALAWLGFGYWSLILGGLVATAVQVLTKIKLAWWRPSLKFSAPAIREILPFGAGVSAKRMLDFGAQNIDSLIVGRLLGITALGYYDKAFNLVGRVLQRLNVGPGVSFRIFSVIQDDPDRFYRGYRKVVLSISLLGYPTFMGIALVAPKLVPFLFGPQWDASILPLQILCAAGALKLLNTYISTATQAKGLIWAEVWRQLLYTGVLIAGIIVGSRWGIDGAAAAVLLATIIMSVLMQSMLRNIANLSWRQLLDPQWPAVVVSLGMAPVVLGADWVCERLRPEQADWQTLMVQIAAGVLWYALFLLLARFGGVRDLVDETLADLAPRLAPLVRFVRREQPQTVAKAGG